MGKAFIFIFKPKRSNVERPPWNGLPVLMMADQKGVKMRYCGRQKNGKALLLTDDEIINNALEQEKSGIKPHYAFYDYKNHEKVTPAGWLVWSLRDGGCGVVYRRKDGKMIITTGLQGDFCYC